MRMITGRMAESNRSKTILGTFLPGLSASLNKSMRLPTFISSRFAVQENVFLKFDKLSGII